MKKLTFVLSVFILASLVLTACGAKTTTTGGGAGTAGLPNLKGKTITVAVENAYPPFNSIDQATGKGVGWDYDAVTEICKRLNCVPEFKQAAWDGIFPAMQAGEYDMLADGVTNYPYRYWAVDFSIPYSLVSQQLLVRASDTHTLDQFKADVNLKVGTQIGTTNYIAATEVFPDKKIQSYSDFGAATLALLAGDIDGVVLDDTAAFGFMQENQGKLKTAGAVKTGDALAFVFPPNSDLEFPVNAALRAMHTDGTLLKINKKWGLSDPAEEPAQ
jgi:polar amino acid transport system substrate-binding protein